MATPYVLSKYQLADGLTKGFLDKFRQIIDKLGMEDISTLLLTSLRSVEISRISHLTISKIFYIEDLGIRNISDFSEIYS